MEKPQIDISATTVLECTECKSTSFQVVYQIRILSPILSPTGETGVIPMQMFQCSKCYLVPEQFLPKV